MNADEELAFALAQEVYRSYDQWDAPQPQLLMTPRELIRFAELWARPNHGLTSPPLTGGTK